MSTLLNYFEYISNIKYLDNIKILSKQNNQLFQTYQKDNTTYAESSKHHHITHAKPNTQNRDIPEKTNKHKKTFPNLGNAIFPENSKRATRYEEAHDRSWHHHHRQIADGIPNLN